MPTDKTNNSHNTQCLALPRTSAEITNHQRDDLEVTRSRTSGILSDYSPAILSTRSMEALAFHPPASGSQSQYMSHSQTSQGIRSQLSQSFTNSLGILNAESYDDVRGALRAREASEMRLKHNESTMPFGIVSGPKIAPDMDLRTDSDEPDTGSRRRKRPRIETHGGEDEEAGKKARGRPRVEPKDENAADRRRTQIRMAQRAYRHRKETTISSLEKRVQDLRGTNEEMSNIFIRLYDFAVGNGLLDREPEFGRQLQSATERFLALAKEAEDHEDSHGEEEKRNEDEGGSSKTKGRRESPNKRQVTPQPVSEPTNAWGGYIVSKEDSPVEAIEIGYQQDQKNKSSKDDFHIITRPTEENASFPFDFMDLQQYRVELPPIEDYSQDFLTQYQLPLPSTHSYQEFSFARRIHRGAIENAFKLITSADPFDARFKQVFGFSLLYESQEAITARLKRLLTTSTKDTLQEWRAPFVHVGGSGTYYPMHDSDVNSDLMPKFRTGYSFGPFDSRVAQAWKVLDDDMNCNLPGFEGEFFDPNDVEGYLRGRGLDIPPAADYVTGAIDLNALSESLSPKSQGSDTVTSILSPQTPRSPTENFRFGDDDFDYGRSDGTVALSKTTSKISSILRYDNWDNIRTMDDSLIDPIFNTIPNQTTSMKSKKSEFTIGDYQYGEKPNVTINVNTLLDEILKRGVCLGRAPGFRPADVNAAIIAAVRAGL